jgi:hypothetical protein
MDKPCPYRAAELSALLAKAYPAARPAMVARAVVGAIKLARYAKRRAEIECSYPMTEENVTRAAKRIERAAAKVNSALENATFPPDGGAYEAPTAAFGGDPRGCCGMLRIPGMQGDGFAPGFPLY